MDKELVLNRLNLLKSQCDNQRRIATDAHNTLMAYDGAIQECNYWLCQFLEESNIEKKNDNHPKKKGPKKHEGYKNPLDEQVNNL
jgi:hypothetical protein